MIITLQEKKLRELLVYAYDNSTYYHRVFEEAGITRKQIPLMPLSAFPVLNKQLLMEHFNELAPCRLIINKISWGPCTAGRMDHMVLILKFFLF